MKRILIILLIIIAIAASSFYLLNIFGPAKIEEAAKEYVWKNFGQKITFSRIRLNIVKGIIFHDASLYEKGEQAPYLKIRSLRVIPFYPSLLAQTKLISLCELDGVQVKLTRNEDGTLGVILPSPAQEQKSLFLIKTFALKNLSVDFEDRAVNFKKKFKDLSLLVRFKAPSWVNFDFSWLNFVSAKGTYNFKTEYVKSRLALQNLNVAEFSPYLEKAGIASLSKMGNFSLKSAILRKGNFSLEGKGMYLLKGSLWAQKMQISLPVAMAGSNQNQTPVEYRGDLELSDIQIKLADKIASYSLTGRIENCSLKNVPFLGNLVDTEVNFTLKNDKFNIDSLKTNLNGAYLQTKAEISDFNEPKIYAEGNCRGELGQIMYTMEKIADTALWRDTKGDADLQFIVRGNLTAKNFDYRIDYAIKNAALYDFKNLKAHGYLQNNVLFLIKALFDYKKIPIVCKGSLTNISAALATQKVNAETLNEPQFKLEGALKTTIAQFMAAAKELKKTAFEYDGPGNIDLKFMLKGNPRKKTFDYALDYDIRQAQLKELTDISMLGNIRPDALNVKEATLRYKNLPFRLYGVLENFRFPRIKLSVENDALSIEAKANYKNENLEIKELFIQGKESKLISHGTLTLSKEPVLALEGLGTLSFTEALNVVRFFDMDAPILSAINPQGMLDTTFLINGTLLPDSWQIKMSAYGEKAKIYNLPFQDIKFDFYRDKEKIIISPLIGSVADGSLKLRTKFDSLNNKTTVNLILNDVDLAIVRDQLNLKNKKLSGKVSVQVDLENDGLSNLNINSGSGRVTVREGNIWEINFLRGLGEFLFIPDFDQIQFHEGSSDLVFKKDGVVFENIQLRSFQMDLEGGGKFFYGGDIHFMLFPRFNNDLISASEGLKKITTAFLGKSGLLIEIKGTLKQPTYQTKPLFFGPFAMEEIKKFFNNLLE